MVKIARFIERVSGALLAVSAICSGNVFVCVVIYVGFVAR
jgi:hypothetical protein